MLCTWVNAVFVQLGQLHHKQTLLPQKASPLLFAQGVGDIGDAGHVVDAAENIQVWCSFLNVKSRVMNMFYYGFRILLYRVLLFFHTVYMCICLYVSVTVSHGVRSTQLCLIFTVRQYILTHFYILAFYIPGSP